MSAHRARLASIAATIGATIVAGCATTPSGSAAAPLSEQGAFVVTLGADTVSVERFTRSGYRIEGDFVQRTPVTFVGRYAATLDASGRPVTLTYSARRPDGSLVPPTNMRQVTLTVSGDSVRRELVRDTVVRQVVAARGAYLTIPGTYALYEAALRALRTAGSDSSVIPFLFTGQVISWPVRFVSPTEARVYYFGDPQRVQLDAQGRVLSVDATATTSKVRVMRVPTADIAALAAAFAARDQSGQALAQTTRDTTRATVGGATLWIDYGRPVARGRTIFGPGGIVPPGVVWRAGANQATHFRTDRDLTIGGATVPAGTYTLFTLPAADGSWKLIINKQTNQWGTVYDPAQDLARVDLRVEPLSTPVERFTIAVEPQGSTATLALSWDRTRLTAPISIR